MSERYAVVIYVVRHAGVPDPVRQPSRVDQNPALLHQPYPLPQANGRQNNNNRITQPPAPPRCAAPPTRKTNIPHRNNLEGRR